MANEKTKILMISAGVLSGSFRRMLYIIENLSEDNFSFLVTYKPNFSKWGQYEIDAIKKSGAHLLPLRGHVLFDIRGFIDLWKILRKEKVSIIHCWDVLGVPARIVGKLAGVKIVQGIGNPPPIVGSGISRKHYLINKFTSILVDGYIANSYGTMQKYKETKFEFLQNKTVAVVYNCVEVPQLHLFKNKIPQIKKKYNISGKETILTNIGYFNEQKAQIDLITALKSVTEKRPNIRLVLVGWGHLEKELKIYAKKNGLIDKIIFTGRLNQTQVFEILSITDLFILPSHWEGFGNVMAEAMAFSKPVISTMTDAGSELVVNGKTGILVPIRRPDRIAQAIIELLSEPELMNQMGIAGFKRVTTYFNINNFRNGYRKFYLDVLR